MEIRKSFVTLLDEVLKENFDFVSHTIRTVKDADGFQYWKLSIPKPAKFFWINYTKYEDIITFKLIYRRIKKNANTLDLGLKPKTIAVSIAYIKCLNDDERKLTQDFAELLEKKLSEDNNAEHLNIKLPIECYM